MQVTPAGLQKALQGIGTTTRRIVRQQGNPVDNTTDLIKGERNFKANAKVVQAEDEMLGTVIDLKA
ncbi:hypothetical protein HOF92_04355 [bacterium]|nr:hypothetical protein [bacterium]